MTFGEMYAECARRLQGKTWNLQVDAGSYSSVAWKVYVAEVSPHFAVGATPDRALIALDAMISAQNLPEKQLPEDVGPVYTGEP